VAELERQSVTERRAQGVVQQSDLLVVAHQQLPALFALLPDQAEQDATGEIPGRQPRDRLTARDVG
jgi:hypothetical protein